MRMFLAAVLLASLSTSASAYRKVDALDGDTLSMTGSDLLTGFNIRMEGIDSPELHSRCAAEVVLARASLARLKQLTADGVTFNTEFRTDRNGRILARPLDRQGRDVGAMLVAEGLARVYDGKTARLPWCDAAGQIVR